MACSAERTFRSGRRRVLLVAAAAALLAPGCRTWTSFKDRTAHIRHSLFDTGYDDPLVGEKLAEADELFNAGQYDKAREKYRAIADNQQNPTDLAERARFQQAECRRLRGQFPEAVDTYHKLLQDFPVGPHRVECCQRMYEIADYWLDDFRNELAKRSDEQGVLRWHPRWPNPFDRKKPLLDQEGRTLEALEHIYTQGINYANADKALFWCGYVNFIRGNFQEADHFFSTLIELHQESPLRPQAIAYAIQSKNNATGGAVYDCHKCAEALKLIHDAEASVPELTQNPDMADKLTRAKFAIRSQQAEKDFRTAEYYERTGHPGSAVFYYELVRRRYAGTRYSDVATDRKETLLTRMREGRPAPGNDPFAIVGAKWKELFGKQQQTGDGPEPAGSDPKLGNGPVSGPVPAGAVGGSPFQPGP